MNEETKDVASLLGKYCVELVVPAAVKSKAIKLWNEVSSEQDSETVSAEQWIPVVIYVAVIESSQPYGPDDPHMDKSTPCCSLGEILKASGLNFIKFSELMRQFRDRVDLSEVVRQHFSSVEKRYCIISPLFHRFDREWGTVFREEDEQQSVQLDETESVQDPKKLCWLLFLNAQDDILSRTEELIQTYHLLLCCLEFVLRDSPAFQLQSPFDSLKLERSATGGSPPSLNFVRTLAEKFHTSLDELKAMQTSTQTYFESLKAANGNLDVTSLEDQYHARQKECGGLDELLFLQHEPTLMPNNFSRVQSGITNNGLDTPVTPVRAAMNTIQQLKNLISANTDHLQLLREHFQNCASNPERSITDRVSQMKIKFLSHYLKTAGTGQGAVAEQRYRQASNLYYRVMKRLLDIERERLAQKDFSSLLNNDVFHRSLLACSTEIVLTTYNVSWSMTHSVLNSSDSKFLFPWVLDVFELYAFDFYKVLESYLKAEPNLTRDIIKHLTSIENRILDSVAWQSDSPVFDILSRCGAISSAYVSPCNDLISAENNNAAKAAEIYMSPSRGQASKGTNSGHIVVMSPRKGGVTMAYSRDSPETRAPDTPKRSHALTMFFNKVCRLGYHRLKTLGDLLRITPETQQKIWTCFECCIISRPELLKDRHLDQIMMCSVYGICKVSDCEIRFKDIVKEYSTMPHAMSEVYKQALLENGTNDSIISFYNRVYMQCMKNYILQFAKPVQPNLSPLPKPVSSSLNSSPVYSIPGRKNFYISPLKESPFKPPCSPSSMTPRSRKLYSFGELLGSAEKLKSINESLSAFKPRGNLPYVTTVKRASSKRLSFDEMPKNSDVTNGDDITDQAVVVKKKRVTPPAVVSISEPGQRNGVTDMESNSK